MGKQQKFLTKVKQTDNQALSSGLAAPPQAAAVRPSVESVIQMLLLCSGSTDRQSAARERDLIFSSSQFLISEKGFFFSFFLYFYWEEAFFIPLFFL